MKQLSGNTTGVLVSPWSSPAAPKMNEPRLLAVKFPPVLMPASLLGANWIFKKLRGWAFAALKVPPPACYHAHSSISLYATCMWCEVWGCCCSAFSAGGCPALCRRESCIHLCLCNTLTSGSKKVTLRSAHTQEFVLVKFCPEVTHEDQLPHNSDLHWIHFRTDIDLGLSMHVSFMFSNCILMDSGEILRSSDSLWYSQKSVSRNVRQSEISGG